MAAKRKGGNLDITVGDLARDRYGFFWDVIELTSDRTVTVSRTVTVQKHGRRTKTLKTAKISRRNIHRDPELERGYFLVKPGVANG